MTENAHPTSRADPGGRLVDVGGYRLWVHVAGTGSPTLVFESGGGDTSKVWSPIATDLGPRLAVRTVVYDRAGLGNSEPSSRPYRIDEEATALRTALTASGVEGPWILVAHSYGGFISLLLAATDPRVAGLVLVDANMPGFFTEGQVARLLARSAPRMEAMQRAYPQVARVMIPLNLALRETSERVRSIDVPSSLPIVDIVAERSWIDQPDEVAAMRREHASFVAASPQREAVFATGSGHYVMVDRPDLVVDAIARLVGRIREGT